MWKLLATAVEEIAMIVTAGFILAGIGVLIYVVFHYS